MPLSVLGSLAPEGMSLSAQDRARLRAGFGTGADRDPGGWALDTAEALLGVRPAVEARAVAERAVVAALHAWLFSGWRPGTVAAPLWVVWAGESIDRGLVTRTDWAAHTRAPVRADRVEGGHYDVLRHPLVAKLAVDLADSTT
ncbi:hypothetical protein [Nonomuraea longicatena]|uniref:Uncharacterized protein n=1 Tax=Nonomuraea longicatena TaxID=83682 RepID=A0ABP4AKA6_9ACTN